MVENTLLQCCPVLAVACLLVQSQPCYQQAFMNGGDTFWEHRLLAKGTLKSEPVKYDSLHAQHSKTMANIGLADDKSGTALVHNCCTSVKRAHNVGGSSMFEIKNMNDQIDYLYSQKKLVDNGTQLQLVYATIHSLKIAAQGGHSLVIYSIYAAQVFL